jgi:hypothetical protein
MTFELLKVCSRQANPAWIELRVMSVRSTVTDRHARWVIINQNYWIRLFFFPPPKSEYFFQQHWESEYFFRKKNIPPPPSSLMFVPPLTGCLNVKTDMYLFELMFMWYKLRQSDLWNHIFEMDFHMTCACYKNWPLHVRTEYSRYVVNNQKNRSSVSNMLQRLKLARLMMMYKIDRELVPSPKKTD